VLTAAVAKEALDAFLQRAIAWISYSGWTTMISQSRFQEAFI
jgi:hypothetical protein